MGDEAAREVDEHRMHQPSVSYVATTSATTQVHLTATPNFGLGIPLF